MSPGMAIRTLRRMELLAEGMLEELTKNPKWNVKQTRKEVMDIAAKIHASIENIEPFNHPNV